MSLKNLGNPIRYKTFMPSVKTEAIGEKAFGIEKLTTVYESKSAIDKSKIHRFIGTSEAVDRDGEIAKLDGWDFKNYVNNPVVLWGHDHKSLPIGKTVGIYKDEVNKVIYFDIEITDSYDFAKSIKALVEEGILRATSVGFRVQEWDYDEKTEAVVFTKSELFEISIVNVPANQDALVQEGKELDELETKNAEAEGIANVITQIQERLEILTQSVESLVSQNSSKTPEGNTDGEAEVGADAEPAQEMLEAEASITSVSDEGTLEIPKTNDEAVSAQIEPDISDELIARVTQAVLQIIQPQKAEEVKEEESPSDESTETIVEPEQEASEPTEPTEPVTEPTQEPQEELIAISVEDIDETEGFVIITEEEN